jgi:hypothetical protein
MWRSFLPVHVEYQNDCEYHLLSFGAVPKLHARLLDFIFQPSQCSVLRHNETKKCSDGWPKHDAVKQRMHLGCPISRLQPRDDSSLASTSRFLLDCWLGACLSFFCSCFTSVLLANNFFLAPYDCAWIFCKRPSSFNIWSSRFTGQYGGGMGWDALVSKMGDLSGESA